MHIWRVGLHAVAGQAGEPTSSHDVHAVVVGHVPYNLAPKVSAFLRREVNKVLPKSQGVKLTEKLDMDWKSRVPTVCMDLRSMLM